jgi:hypothetical protein
MAGAVYILSLLVERRIYVTAVHPPDHGKQRGTTALHIAVLENHRAAAEYLVSHGADPLYLDLYGRTSMDWAAHDDSGNMLRSLQPKGHIYTPTNPATQTSILKETITGLASQLLAGDTSEIAKLAQCLQYLGNLKAAWTLYAQSPSYCDTCRVEIPRPHARFLCKICRRKPFCQKFPTLQVGFCRNHEFWRVVCGGVFVGCAGVWVRDGGGPVCKEAVD